MQKAIKTSVRMVWRIGAMRRIGDVSPVAKEVQITWVKKDFTKVRAWRAGYVPGATSTTSCHTLLASLTPLTRSLPQTTMSPVGWNIMRAAQREGIELEVSSESRGYRHESALPMTHAAPSPTTSVPPLSRDQD